jgi:hypothetical protein
MKRYASVVLAILLVAGMGTTNIAGAYTLAFQADFWATGNPVNNYSKGGPGDLGGTFILFPGEKINVDIFFSTDLALVAASWDLKYSPAALATVNGTSAPSSPWVLPLFEPSAFPDSSGSQKFQAAVFPGSTVSGDNIFFGSVLFECKGVGDVNLVLANYLGFLTAIDTIDIGNNPIGTIQQTPIPGAVWLLGTGLLGLVGLSRKWRK